MSAADTPGNFTDGQVTASDDGGNSEILALFMGDFSISTKPGGRETEAYEAQGHLTGLRDGARFFATITFTAQHAEYDDDFEQLVNGVIAGFVSVTADIGDRAAFDLAFDGSYGADSRTLTAEDCVLDTFDMSQGSPSNKSFSVICYGPITINGRLYVPAR